MLAAGRRPVLHRPGPPPPAGAAVTARRPRDRRRPPAAGPASGRSRALACGSSPSRWPRWSSSCCCRGQPRPRRLPDRASPTCCDAGRRAATRRSGSSSSSCGCRGSLVGAAGRAGPRRLRRAHPDLRPQPAGQPGHPRRHRGRRGRRGRRDRARRRRRRRARRARRARSRRCAGGAARRRCWSSSWPGAQGIDGYRLVLVGIGARSAMLPARARLPAHPRRHQRRRAANVWLTGSLNGRALGPRRAAGASRCACCCPLALAARPRARRAAVRRRHRPRPRRRLQLAQAAVVLVAVALAAFAVAAAGPIEFVALVVPQIAVRLTGGSRPPLLAAGLLGAAAGGRQRPGGPHRAARRAAGRRRHRRRRRPVPALAPRPRKAANDPVTAADRSTSRRTGPAGRRRVRLGLRRPGRRRRPGPGAHRRVVHRDRRPQRLRQVHPAARAWAGCCAPQRGPGAARRPRDRPARRPARSPRCSACCRSRRSRPRG